ncbi:excinuclease ABC subunit A, partial [Listeria monocytogenes]|nr:excinuclease ABC subunit A [Listeria monocytogenes]
RSRYGFKSLMHASSLLNGATGLKRSDIYSTLSRDQDIQYTYIFL